ncbi:hypothetical protein HYY69_06030 [Candidatus Woesearchaeota archaeon]|nr:hypothetical protein [Candidatus Woesearchaeota archaeon]
MDEVTKAKVNDGFIQQLRRLGLAHELGWDRGEFYSPSELEAMTRKYSDPRVLYGLLDLLQQHGNPYSMHEVLHCFDVGKSAAELAEKLQEFNTPIRQANNYFPLDPEDAFLAGVFHDIALAFKPTVFEDQALRVGLAELVKSEAQKTAFLDGVLYNKGAVEDDVFGRALLGKVGLSDRRDLGIAVVSALPLEEQRQLAVSAVSIPMLHKVLDGLWYHDGNNPVRGFAEACMLVGDRLPLYDAGKINAQVVAQGVKKLLTYTEPEEGWKQRGAKTDILYMEKMVEKKAPGFIASVKGTPVYDFMVEDLACRQRGERSLQSPSFMIPFVNFPNVLGLVEQRQELKQRLSSKLDELYQRHQSLRDAINQGDYHNETNRFRVRC